MGESACLMCASQQGWEQAWSILGLQSVSHQCCNVGDAFSVGWNAHRQTPETEKLYPSTGAHVKTNTWKYRHVAHAYKVCSKGNSRLDHSFDLCKFVQENSKKGLMSNSYLNSLSEQRHRRRQKKKKKHNERGQRSPEHLFRKWYDQVTNLVHLIIYQCARQWRQCRF